VGSGHTVIHPRATAGGYAERMRALAEFDADAPPTLQSAAEDVAGTDVRIEDALDAALLAYTARPGPGELRTLPAEAEATTDPTGLPMRLFYRSEEPLA